MEVLDVRELCVEDFALDRAGGLFVVVVEAQFAPCDAFWIDDDCAEFVPHMRTIISVERMDAC